MITTKKYKNWILVLSILSGLLFILVVFQFVTTIPKDEVKERERLLAAVVREIKIPEEDIEEITVLWTKALDPYKYGVAINKKNGNQVVYYWKDENKEEVLRSGSDDW